MKAEVKKRLRQDLRYLERGLQLDLRGVVQKAVTALISCRDKIPKIPGTRINDAIVYLKIALQYVDEYQGVLRGASCALREREKPNR